MASKQSWKSVLWILLISVLVLRLVQPQQSFSYEPSVNAPGLQIDSSGRTFVSAGSTLYRLSPELVEEERVSLSAPVVDRGLSLSADGTRLVVCLTNRSCSVFNATHLSAGPLRTVSNAIASADFGVALFTAGDTFYTGSVSGETGEAGMVLQQFGEDFVRSSNNNDAAHGGVYSFSPSFPRDFYGGFERDGFAYYVTSDYPVLSDFRGIRLLRVCNNMSVCGGASSCGVNALYEAGFMCGLDTFGNRVRVCGVSVLEDFGGMTGPIAVISRCEPGTTRNRVCLVNITAANEAMDRVYDTCVETLPDPFEETGIAWNPNERCNQIIPLDGRNRCNIPSQLGTSISEDIRIQVSGFNTLTSSVAVKVDQFSFVYVGTTSSSGVNMISGFDASGSSTFTSFYSQPVNSTVHLLSWQQGQGYITAATSDTVFQIPIEECSSHSDCVNCTADDNPLCGWCVVENKCSRQTQCQNSTLTSSVRWTQDSNNCITVSVSPSQLVLDPNIMPENLTVTVSSPGLPAPLSGESFSCHLADSEDRFPPIVVPALEISPSTEFSCNITGLVPDYQGVTAVMDVGFESSLFTTPFDISNGVLTIYRCFNGTSCSDCLHGNSLCGWCNLNKVCSGTSSPCRNDSFFVQISPGKKSSDLCPLVDQPPSGAYTQPVEVDQDIRLATSNLIPPPPGFQYSCVVNGVPLTAQYENESSILCLVEEGQLTLPAGEGSTSVVAMVMWIGSGVNHAIDSAQNQTLVTLYDCPSLADGCSQCVGTIMGSGFMCGWCQMTGTCEVTQECFNMPVIDMATGCPSPIITSFFPITGPMEGGTSITVWGSDLGVTFSDLQSGTVTLGEVPCVPVDIGYISGEQFVCVTNTFTSPGDKSFNVTIGTRQSMTSASPMVFRAVEPTVTGVSPNIGPVAGGSTVYVNGTSLDVGNQGNTTVTFELNGVKPTNVTCDIQSISAEVVECETGAGDMVSSALVVVTIDAARVSSPSVLFNYLSDPNVTSVTPRNTIPSGGITLTFTGENLDVVQAPVLEVRLSVGGPLRTSCSVDDSSTITCEAPHLMGAGGSALDYSLIMDGVVTTSTDLPISVLPDPTNFRLGDVTDITTGSSTIIQILGDNLQSVLPEEVTVTVGEEECQKTSAATFAGGEIFCTAPANPPGGVLEANIRVMVGRNIDISLTETLRYPSTGTSSGTPLEVVIPVVVVLFVGVVSVFFIIIVCILVSTRRKSVDLSPIVFELQGSSSDGKGPVFANTEVMKSQVEAVMQQIPDSIKIPYAQMKLERDPIGQGEFGVVYKGTLADWNQVPVQAVAVKTLRGLFSSSDVKSMVSEIVKMKEFHHPHIMSLIGVCLDAGPGVSIVMPFMANGNLLEYLKRERPTLELDDDAEIDQILAVRKLLLRKCHHIALGMAYLAEQKFVHRDLAARNCMLDSQGDIKVGDFGLAEDVYVTGYFRQKERADVKLPFKWMAIESLNDAIFTEKTDVWAYGVTVWEVFSCGRTPFPAMDPMSLVQWLTEGNRLERPTNAACATEISAVMRKCWRVSPEERPTFSEICSLVDRLLMSIAGYTELSMVLPQPADTVLEYNYVLPEATDRGPVSLSRVSSPPLEPTVTDNPAYGVREQNEGSADTRRVPPLSDEPAVADNAA